MKKKDDEDNIVNLMNAPKRGPQKGYKKKVELTPKMAAFAEALAAGVHFADAFRQTYETERMKPHVAYKLAHRTKQNPRIQERVKELQGQINKVRDATLAGLPSAIASLPQVMREAVDSQLATVGKTAMTRERVIAELADCVRLGKECGQISASVSALEKIAKIEGYTTDNRESRVTNELERMSPQELRAYIREQFSQSGSLLSDENGQGELVDMRPISDTLN